MRPKGKQERVGGGVGMKRVGGENKVKEKGYPRKLREKNGYFSGDDQGLGW